MLAKPLMDGGGGTGTGPPDDEGAGTGPTLLQTQKIGDLKVKYKNYLLLLLSKLIINRLLRIKIKITSVIKNS